MVDNFELLRDLYDNNPSSGDEDTFLFGQIMGRKKDGARFVKSSSRIIKDLVFRSPEDFDNKKDEIIEMCEMFGARAYLNINPRSYKAVTIEMAGLCLDYIRKGSECASRTAFATVCGRIKPKHGYWVIDVDDLAELESISDLVPNPVLRVPTVNGVHIISGGFDLRELRDKFPDVDIHKNNPTMLYFNS